MEPIADDEGPSRVDRACGQGAVIVETRVRPDQDLESLYRAEPTLRAHPLSTPYTLLPRSAP
jgi:hypothetical protein